MNQQPPALHPEILAQPALEWRALSGLIADSLPAMIWMCGIDGRLTLFNKRWLEFTGYTRQQALDEGWLAAVHPDEVHQRSATQQAVEAHRPFETGYRLRRADGEYRWMLDQGAPQFDAQGDFCGYVGVAVDITERKRAEDKLRWLFKAVEQSPATVVITDLTGTIEYVNPKFTEVTGYSFEEAIGQNPRMLKSGETHSGEYRKLWETIRTGEWRGEFHNRRKNGELYWEAASISPIRDETGKPTHYIAVKEDITERKRMEAALRVSDQRIRAAVESAKLWIYDVDPATGIGEVYGTDTFLKRLRSPREWADAVHPDDRERVWAAHLRRIESGSGVKEEYRMVDADGTVRHYSDHGVPNGEGWVTGVLRDITEEKQAQESMARLAAVVECCNDAVISVDADSTVRSWNRAAQNLYGYAPAEILGRPALELMPPERRADAGLNLSAVVSGMSRALFETRQMRKDGTAFPASITASPILDQAGRAVGGSVIIRDITRQKAAEEALRESENRFRALVQNSTDLITLLDPEGVILYDSPGVSAMVGVSPESRLGCEAIQWVHPDDRPYLWMLHQKLLQGAGVKARAQVRLRHADGSWRWCDSQATNLLEEPGVRALATSFRDISGLKAAESALRESEERYRMLIEDASDAIFTMDLDGRCTALNGASQRISGYSQQEALGMALPEIIAPDRLSALLEHFQATLTGKTTEPVETELVARDGHRVSVEVSGRPQIRDGSPVGLLCIARDISQRKRAERRERHRREVLEMIAQNQPLGAVLRRLEQMIEQYHPGTAARITLLAESGSPAPPEPNGASSGEQPGLLRVPIRASNGQLLGNIEIAHPETWKPTEFERLSLDSKARLASIAVEHRQLTDRLAHQAQHDPLTGLPNRSLLDDRLRQAISLARRQERMVAVLYVDLDRFKYINDTLGHDVGDKLLIEAAKRLQSAVRESDTLARTGGDEFVAVLFGIERSEDAELVGERILEAMQQPFEVMGHELFASASVGLSLFPQDGEDAATLQKHADVAMYEAKNRGRNRFQKFERQLTVASHERLEIENQLHRALERHELELYYQPLIELSSGYMGGVEALLRWNHPKWGLVPPSRFVPVAEDSGLIIPISLWVLREACRQHQLWRRGGHPPLRIAVNISAIQVARTSLADTVAAVLAAYSIEPQYLELELTEGILMRDVADSTRQIAALRDLGVQISIDDFGTGYSSLAYLQRLPIDNLKIDRCFVEGIGHTAGNQRLVQAIVGLAHGLNMTATAEGVETEEQLALLRALGCDRAQGFLLGRPAPVSQCESFWQTRGPQAIFDPGSLLDLPA
ncbi:MAG TPA: PAS domain S-box protein [Bryobacteraceae bacterium]|nr:PAS domain S-box protein [Bryobacteraceae bacterium]